MDWLLDGPAWIIYAVQSQLLEQTPSIEPVLKDESVRTVLDRMQDDETGFPALQSGSLSYKTTPKGGNVYWDLFFLSDIGLKAKDLSIEQNLEDIFQLQLPDKLFMTWNEMRPSYYCISTIIIASIIKMQDPNDYRIRQFIEMILNTQRLDGGWHCSAKRAIGKKYQHTESCPMDNLNILYILGQYPEYRKDPGFYGAINLLLRHWEKRQEHWRPYGFGVGSRYSALKYPVVKYGILRVLDVLSLYPHALKDDRFHEMLSFVKKKSQKGKYLAESVVQSFKGFEFGQKRKPSRWITLLVERIEKRLASNLET